MVRNFIFWFLRDIKSEGCETYSGFNATSCEGIEGQYQSQKSKNQILRFLASKFFLPSGGDYDKIIKPKLTKINTLIDYTPKKYDLLNSAKNLKHVWINERPKFIYALFLQVRLQLTVK